MAIPLKFTSTNISQLKFSENNQIVYSDTQTQYLILIISQTKKVFYYYRKIKSHKSPRKIKLGKWPEMSVTLARKECERKTKEIVEGKIFKNKIKFKGLFEKYYEKHLKPSTKRYKDTKRNYEKYLNMFHNKEITDISREDIIDCHNYITEKNGEYAANRAIQLIRAAINWGIKTNVINCENPATKILMNDEYPRERFITPNEINIFLEALEFAPIASDKRDIIKCLLFIGQRKINTCSMCIKNVNLAEKQWTIPGKLTKNKKPYKAELLDFIVDILRTRIEKSKQYSKYVFPANSKTGHVVEIRSAWHQIKKTANDPERLELLKKYQGIITEAEDIDKERIIDERNKKLAILDKNNKGEINNIYGDLILHDLRRTLGSWQIKVGTSLYVTGKSLGHNDPNSTATKVYANILRDTVRDSIQKATDAMRNANRPGKSDKIQNLKNIINSIDANSEEEFKKKVLELFF